MCTLNRLYIKKKGREGIEANEKKTNEKKKRLNEKKEGINENKR